MNASTIKTAIDAMRAVDDLHFCGRYSTEELARAWNELSSARNALEAELIAECRDIKIEAQS